MALDAGIDKLRINPGNIGDADKVRAVVRRAQEHRCAGIVRHDGFRQSEQVRVFGAAHVEAAAGRTEVQQHAQVAEPQVGIDQQRAQ